MSRDDMQNDGAGPDLRIAGEAPPDWDDLVAADPDADFFHSRRWTEAVGRCYRDKTPLWMTVRLRERLVGGLAVLHTTGRSLDLLESNLEGTSGGPIIPGDLPVDLAGSLFYLLVDHFHQLRSGLLGSLSLSLNPGHENRFGALLADEARWVRHHHPAAVISLEGGIEEVEMGRIKKTKRNERNRALKRGVIVEVTQDPRWLAEYYPIYAEASRRWGVQAAPLEFLQDLLTGSPANGEAEGGAFFTCVRIEDKVVGGHLNLHFKNRVIAWNGVTDPAYARSHFPATAAIWGDLVESCRLGADWLDLGGSGGVVKLGDFKRSFGAEEQTRGWYTSDTAALRLLRFGRRGLRRLSSLGRTPGSAAP